MEAALDRMELLSGKINDASRLSSFTMNVYNSQISNAGSQFSGALASLSGKLNAFGGSMGSVRASIAAVAQAAKNAIQSMGPAHAPPLPPPPPAAPPATPGAGGMSPGASNFWLNVNKATSGFALLSGAIALVTGAFYKMWNNLSGFSYGSRITEMFKTIPETLGEWRRGNLIGFGTGAKIKMGTTREFGGVGQAPSGVTDQISRYASVGVSSEAQTRLAGEMYRIAGYGAQGTKAATDILQTTYAIAKKNKIGADDLMKSMAQNTDLLANAANRVPGALERAVIQANRMAVTIQTSEGFANRITSDFETYLDMQARLQTVMPGVDLTNVMMASQYGGAEDIQNALKSTFAGMDIGAMPRSIRQMISSTTGISESDLVKLGKASGAGAVAAATKKEKEAADKLVTWAKLSTILLWGFGAIVTSIGLLAAATAFRGATGRMATSVLSKVPFIGRRIAAAKAARVAARAARVAARAATRGTLPGMPGTVPAPPTPPTVPPTTGPGLMSRAWGATKAAGTFARGALNVGGRLVGLGGTLAGSSALAIGGTVVGGLAAGLYAGDRMFNKSVAKGGSGNLGDFWNYGVGKSREEKASEERAQTVARSRGFGSFEEMQLHNRQQRERITTPSSTVPSTRESREEPTPRRETPSTAPVERNDRPLVVQLMLGDAGINKLAEVMVNTRRALSHPVAGQG